MYLKVLRSSDTISSSGVSKRRLRAILTGPELSAIKGGHEILPSHQNNLLCALYQRVGADWEQRRWEGELFCEWTSIRGYLLPAHGQDFKGHSPIEGQFDFEDLRIGISLARFEALAGSERCVLHLD